MARRSRDALYFEQIICICNSSQVDKIYNSMLPSLYVQALFRRFVIFCLPVSNRVGLIPFVVRDGSCSSDFVCVWLCCFDSMCLIDFKRCIFHEDLCVNNGR